MPDRIGRYRVRRRLGSGGFATVWLAEDDVLDTTVAIKVLADNWADHLDVRARFVEEARILRRADSDRLVRVLDIGDLPDGRPYSVLTHADRGTLADRLAQGALPIADALELGTEIARGVAVLHGIGIIHRDLKPSNVLFGRDGSGRERVLVADLGLAKAVATASGFTVGAGSRGYMAPEQAVPGGGIDVRADVYGLGALVYHMLTGAPPDGEPPQPPSAHRPELPAQLDQIVLRALQHDPELRWSSADHLADALDSALAGVRHDSVARAPDSGTRRMPAVTRRRVRALLAAAVAIALAGAGISAYSSSGWVRVDDATRTLSVEVPSQWALQLQDAGWSPARIGLAGGHSPGLAVSSDLGSWWEPASSIPGVFVGVAAAPVPEQAAAAPDHSSCSALPVRQFRSGTLNGAIRRWVQCDNAEVSFSEALLLAEAGSQGVFVQIKQDGETDYTDRILASVRMGSG